MVLASSPVRRRGSTLKEPPSISPTLSSVFAPFLGLGACVPPVIFLVFSGLESLGTKLGSTLVMSSGGGESAPRSGISLAMVEVVLVMCGTSGFCVWNLRYSWAVSFARLLSAVKSGCCRAVVVERARQHVRAVKTPGRIASRADAIVVDVVRSQRSACGKTRADVVLLLEKVLCPASSHQCPASRSSIGLRLLAQSNIDFWPISSISMPTSTSSRELALDAVHDRRVGIQLLVRLRSKGLSNGPAWLPLLLTYPSKPAQCAVVVFRAHKLMSRVIQPARLGTYSNASGDLSGSRCHKAEDGISLRQGCVSLAIIQR